VRYFTVASLAAFLLVAAANWDRVDERANLLLAIVLGLLTLLYFALFLIVRRGPRITDKHDFERKRAELALVRQKDLYDVLSQSTKAMVRIVDRDELFATVCRVAVEYGHFRFAWIASIDNHDQWLKPVARYGEDAGYIDQLDVSGDGASALRNGLTRRMLLSGVNVVSNDLLNDPERAPWHEAARRAGVRASAKFPIREGGAVVGAINLYAGEPGFFTEELVATLEQTANDVSFALDNYARETARKQALALLEKSERRYRTIIQTAIDGFCMVDTEGCFLEVNDAYCRLIGYRREELLKMRIPDVDAIRTPEDIARHLREIVRKGYDHFVSRLRRKDGQLLDIEFSANLIPDPDGERLFVLMRDITERRRAEQERRDYAGRLRSLARRLFTVEETERRNINRELHDRIGQSLAALNISLNIIRSQLPQESLDMIGARLQDTQTLLEGTAVQIRNIMAELHPPALDDYGLLAALRTYAESFGARVGVPITVHGEDLAPRLSLATETALFRISQEALTNAVKHARARNIEVALGAAPERVTLTIDDDGVGFDAGYTMPAGNRWGFATMRERADAVGATLRIESAPGRGVHVIVEIPRRAA
jgi:PAS domain S-box-containing protein